MSYRLDRGNKNALTECDSVKGKTKIPTYTVTRGTGNVKRGSVVCPYCQATFPDASFIYVRGNEGIVGCNVCLKCYKAKEVYERC